MGKTRNKNKSSDEYLRGEIRKLKKENKQLRKELNRNYTSQDEEEIIDSEDTHPRIYKELCHECGKGELRVFEIVGRTYHECTICNYRKKLS